MPLKHVNERLRIYPLTTPRLAESAEMDWRKVRKAGDMINAIHVLQSEKKTNEYWICTAIKRESYPEEETGKIRLFFFFDIIQGNVSLTFHFLVTF